MRRPYIVVVVIAVLLLSCAATGDSTFRLGAVLSTQGETATMVEARNGYELAVRQVNAQSFGRGFLVGGQNETRRFHFKYDFTWRDDKSDPEIHAKQFENLIKRDKVHFLAGSHPNYAADEMRIANDSQFLNYQCCAGPDELYAHNYPTVFGLPASNTQYTKNSIRAVGLQSVRKMMLVYDEDSVFTRTTCESAIQYLKEKESVMSEQTPPIVMKFGRQDTDRTRFFVDVAEAARDRGVEVVYACVFPNEGKKLVNAMHDIRYALKAFFLTTGPTKQNWIDGFDPAFRANGLLSAAQWHPNLRYRDDVMGSAREYADLYSRTFNGQKPSYVAAAASAVGVTLTMAIQEAFRSCDISQTNGDVELLLNNPAAIRCDDPLGKTGYERILTALWKLNTETFFGFVKFNDFRRNDGLETVTTQVFEEIEEDGSIVRKIEVVLPVQSATHLLKFPAPNFYREGCRPGYKQNIDPFQECLPCQQGQASHKTDARHCDRCPLGEWTNLTAQSECFRCPAGTTTQMRGAHSIEECKCKVGYFNADGETGVACDPCPVGAVCPGGTEPPTPLRGYWANETRRSEIYACDDASVCTGGKGEACRQGHTGR